jgi:hypothetical protein
VRAVERRTAGRSDLAPEIADARDATLKAVKEAEHGWYRAMDKIGERAGLTKGPDGVWRDTSMSDAAWVVMSAFGSKAALFGGFDCSTFMDDRLYPSEHMPYRDAVTAAPRQMSAH